MFKKFFQNKEMMVALEGVKHDPENLLKLEILGSLYLKNNFYDDAINVFEKILRIDENYLPALKILGKCYILKKQYLKAFRTLMFLCEKVPEDTHSKTLLFSLKNADCDIEAKAQILKGLAEVSDDVEIKEMLGEIYIKSGQFSKSMMIFENLAAIEEKSKYLIELSQIYEKLNKFEKIADVLEKLMLTDDFQLAHAQNLAETYVKLKRFEEAKGLYELLIENSPPQANYFKEKIAEILLQEKNPDEVIEVAKNVIEADKYTVDAKFLHAQALLEKKDFREAIDFLRDFYCDPVDKITEKKIEKKIIEAVIGYAQNLRENRKFVEAIDTLVLALRYDENNKDVYIELARISTEIRDFAAAKEYMKIAEEL